MNETLQVEIKLLNEQFKKSAKQSKEAVKGITSEVNKAKTSCAKLDNIQFNKFKKAVKGLTVAIGATIAGLVAMGTQAVKLGDNIDKASQKANMSIKGYQQWGYILGQCGADAASLGVAMKKLSQTQGQALQGNQSAIQSFAKLGITQAQLAKMRPEELFELTTKQLQNVSNSALRSSLAMEIMGKSASELNGVFNLSNQETDALRRKYDMLGGSMSSGLVKTTAQVKDAVADLKVAWQGLVNVLAEWVLPKVKEVVDWLTQTVVKVREFVKIVFGLKSTGSITAEIAPTGAVEDYTESVEDAQKETKKLLTLIGGFDELNRLNPKEEENTSSGSGSGSSGGLTSSIKDDLEFSEDAYKLPEKWVEFAQKIHDNFDKIKGLVETIGLGILAWKLSEGFLEGIKSLEDLKKTVGITLIVTGVKIVWDAGYDMGYNGITPENLLQFAFGTLATAIGALLTFGPWGVAFAIPLSVIVAGIAFFKGFNDKVQKLYEDSELRKEIQQVRDDIEQHSLENLKLRAEIENITGDIKQEDLEKIDTLKAKLDELFKIDSKDNKTAEEIRTIQSLCDEINETNLLPFKLEYDETTGHINQTKKAVDEVIESLLKQYKVEALKDAITEAYKKQAEAAKQAETAENDLHNAKVEHSKAVQDATTKTNAYNKAMEEYNEYTNNGMSLTAPFSKKFWELNNAVNNTKAEMKAANKVLDDANTAVDEAQGAVDEANTTLGTAKDKVSTLEDELKDILTPTKEETDKLTDLGDAASDSKDDINDAATAMGTAKTNADKLKTALEEQKKEFEKSKKPITDYITELGKIPKKLQVEIEQNIEVNSDAHVNISTLDLKKPLVNYKFAEGAVVHQPTIAQVGEYQGAQTNPEIITPESKMRAVFDDSNSILADVFVQVGQQIVSAINEQDLSVSIDDETIAKSASRGNRAYQTRTGRSLLV